MPMTIDELRQISSTDLSNWVKPRVVDSGRADLMLEAAVDAVADAVSPRTSVPLAAKAIVLEMASRATNPGVQQESLGSRSVSFFAPGDPRSGVFLTDDERGRLGVLAGDAHVGVVWTRTKFGSVP